MEPVLKVKALASLCGMLALMGTHLPLQGAPQEDCTSESGHQGANDASVVWPCLIYSWIA